MLNNNNNRISTIETIPGDYYFGRRYTQSMQISDQTIIMAPAPAMIITVWFGGSGSGSSNNKSAFTFDGYADEYQFT